MVVSICAIVSTIHFVVGKEGEKGNNISDSDSNYEVADSFSEKKDDKFIINSIVENDENVYVEFSYGTFKYPYAFSDLISITPINEGEYKALVFKANIDGNTLKVFSVWFNNPGIGHDVGTVNIPGGDTVDICVEFHNPPEFLSESELYTFRAAQEVFNDVVNSFADNDNFSIIE